MILSDFDLHNLLTKIGLFLKPNLEVKGFSSHCHTKLDYLFREATQKSFWWMAKVKLERKYNYQGLNNLFIYLLQARWNLKRSGPWLSWASWHFSWLSSLWYAAWPKGSHVHQGKEMKNLLTRVCGERKDECLLLAPFIMFWPPAVSWESQSGNENIHLLRYRLDGKTVVITGADTNFGIELVREMCKRGASKVIMAVEDVELGQVIYWLTSLVVTRLAF